MAKLVYAPGLSPDVERHARFESGRPHQINMSKDYIGLFLLGILVLGMLYVATWYAGTRSAQARHCIELHEGIPVNSGNDIVCLRKDAIL